MVIEHNGQTITLPDIPADVLAQYPYAVIMEFRSLNTNEIICYRLLFSTSVFGFIPHNIASALGYEYPVLGSLGNGAVYYIQNNDSDWMLSNNQTPPWGYGIGERLEGHEDVTSLIWSNSDVHIVESIDASYNVTWSDDIYFLNSTVEYEPEYSAPSSWFVGLADQARRLSGVTKRYDRDDILAIFTDIALGQGEINLLWQTSSLKSSFSAQTITLSDAKSYDLYIFIFAHDITYQSEISALAVPEESSYGHGCCTFGSYPTASCYVPVSRVFSVYKLAGAVKFGNGYKNGTKDNSVCIPSKIYGINFR